MAFKMKGFPMLNGTKPMKMKKEAAMKMKKAAAMKAAKPDFPDIDGDGDTTESMKKAGQDMKSAKQMKKESSMKMKKGEAMKMKKGEAMKMKEPMKMKDKSAMKMKEESAKKMKTPMKNEEDKKKLEKKSFTPNNDKRREIRAKYNELMKTGTDKSIRQARNLKLANSNAF